MWWDTCALLFCVLTSLVFARIAHAPLRLDDDAKDRVSPPAKDRERARVPH
jgi:hypothetical protein